MLGSLFELPPHPSLVVGGKEFAAERLSELIERSGLVTDKSEPAGGFVDERDWQNALKYFTIGHSHRALVLP